MTEVIRLQTFRTSRPRSRASMSNVDLLVELAKLRDAAALLESDLAEVKQRLLHELSKHEDIGQPV